MGKADFLKLGDWNAVCYQCGFKRKASYLVKNWQGYYVCPEHNEPRQPQDFVRAVPDVQTPPWTQPAPVVMYTISDEPTQPFQGDGVNVFFEAGDGLYPMTVTEVRIDGIPTVLYTVNSLGLITMNTPPDRFARVSASGVEIVQ